MLRKLLKYDLIWMEKYILFFAVAALLLSFAARLLNEIANQSAVLMIVDKFVFTLYCVSLVALLLVTFMMCIIRFKRNIYNDESYLVHTLPVSRGTVYHSKMLSSFIALILSTFIFIVCIAIVELDQGTMEELKNILSSSDYVTIIVAFLLAYVFQSGFIFLAAIVGMEIGHRRGSKKLLHSVLAAVIIYGAAQTIGSFAMILLGFFDTDMNTLYTASPGTYGMDLLIDTMKRFSWISTIIYFVSDIALFIAGKIILQKGVNVE